MDISLKYTGIIFIIEIKWKTGIINLEIMIFQLINYNKICI